MGGASQNLIRSIVANQAGNIRRAITGQRVALPSLGNATVGRDDVDIARSLKTDPVRRNDPARVEAFETQFARWNGSRCAVGFSSGREALSAAIAALGLTQGDQVIIPAYTCVVVPNAFRFEGIEVIYADIELETFGLDATLLEGRVTDKVRAILIHHLYGLVCRDYEKILSFADAHDLWVIEDCAHSTGAEWKDIRVGNRGDVAFYSSEQSKAFSTIQGGVAATNNLGVAERLRSCASNMKPPSDEWVVQLLDNVVLAYYESAHPMRWITGDLARVRYAHRRMTSTTPMEEQGERPPFYGRRMAPAVAALASNQLAKLDGHNRTRRQTALRWDAWTEAQGYEKPKVVPGSTPVFLRYPVLVEPERKRDTGWTRKELGVVAGLWFVSNEHPVQRRLIGYPNAARAIDGCINLPCMMA